MSDRATNMRSATTARMAGAADDPFRQDLVTTLAHHDAAINGLSGRMTGVEAGLNKLQDDVHNGFNGMQQTMTAAVGALSSKFDRIEARPSLDVHKVIGSVVSVAVLFSMVCAGIIWITTSQFSGFIAKQDAINEREKSRNEWQTGEINKSSDRLHRVEGEVSRIGEWMTTVHVKVPKRWERSQ